MLTTEKTCNQCGAIKPLAEFYKNIALRGGHQNTCKVCCIARSRRNQEARKAYYKKQRRARSATPEYIEKRKAYAKTEAGKLARMIAYHNHVTNFPGKTRARTAVKNAIRDGRLIRQPCKICGQENAHAHHVDYRKPFAIEWMCFKHHREHHRNESL